MLFANILFVLAFCFLGSVFANDTPKDCPGVCPAIYQPVCAYDCEGRSKTYGNKCLYLAALRCDKKAAGFTKYTSGECPKPPKWTTEDPCGKSSEESYSKFCKEACCDESVETYCKPIIKTCCQPYGPNWNPYETPFDRPYPQNFYK